jgi:hypothetical protein
MSNAPTVRWSADRQFDGKRATCEFGRHGFRSGSSANGRRGNRARSLDNGRSHRKDTYLLRGHPKCAASRSSTRAMHIFRRRRQGAPFCQPEVIGGRVPRVARGPIEPETDIIQAFEPWLNAAPARERVDLPLLERGERAGRPSHSSSKRPLLLSDPKSSRG